MDTTNKKLLAKELHSAGFSTTVLPNGVKVSLKSRNVNEQEVITALHQIFGYENAFSVNRFGSYVLVSEA